MPQLQWSGSSWRCRPSCRRCGRWVPPGRHTAPPTLAPAGPCSSGDPPCRTGKGERKRRWGCVQVLLLALGYYWRDSAVSVITHVDFIVSLPFFTWSTTLSQVFYDYTLILTFQGSWVAENSSLRSPIWLKTMMLTMFTDDHVIMLIYCMQLLLQRIFWIKSWNVTVQSTMTPQGKYGGLLCFSSAVFLHPLGGIQSVY